MLLYHGSAHRIVRGGTVRPASRSGARVNHAASDPWYACASRDLGEAAHWGAEASLKRYGLRRTGRAGRSGLPEARLAGPVYVYLVEALGATETGPASPESSVRSAAGFRVVGWVPKRERDKAYKQAAERWDEEDRELASAACRRARSSRPASAGRPGTLCRRRVLPARDLRGQGRRVSGAAPRKARSRRPSPGLRLG